MPKPEIGETEKDYLKRCIPELIGEGRPQKQSIAICFSMYRKSGTESKSPKPSKKSLSKSSNKLFKKQVYCYLCF